MSNFTNSLRFFFTPTIIFRDKSPKNIEKFKERLGNLNWSTIENCSDPINTYSLFLTKFTDIYNDCFPLKKVSKSSKVSKPWISKGLLKSIKMKNKVYKQFLHNPNSLCENTYENYKIKLTHSIRVAKRLYYDEKNSKIINQI